MFQQLSGRLGQITEGLRGRGRLTEDNIKQALREVRMALLEADVALPVVKDFVAAVRERAVGAEVQKSLTPGQVLVKIVHDELIQVMGDAAPLTLNVRPPLVILLAGLQGAGKTTSAAKLARWLKEKHNKTVCLTSCDVYRPAAMDQLQRLAGEVDATYYQSSDDKPVAIARAALEEARSRLADVLIVDTAGRLHVDEALMDEIRAIHAAVTPTETLFVVDSMAGQDAANAARAFNEALPLTGIVLTKADGDARGGVALSARQITGAPVKFLGVGEKNTALEPFDPERIASRILGMGDVVSLVEQVESQTDQQQAEKLAAKLKKGKGFDLADFKNQLAQMQSMGGMGAVMDKLPGMGGMMAKRPNVDPDQADRDVRRQIAIINSMTPAERRAPAIIKGSRRRRIAAGSGLQVQDVNRLLKQFTQAQRMMKQFAKGGMGKLMRSLGRG
ncbi:MAG TPA: signal recognition particle protein [Gammaproteobacteria bacterium]|nr:signal recognition particle protein [Gammaproteobacteria bacterium]